MRPYEGIKCFIKNTPDPSSSVGSTTCHYPLLLDIFHTPLSSSTPPFFENPGSAPLNKCDFNEKPIEILIHQLKSQIVGKDFISTFNIFQIIYFFNAVGLVCSLYLNSCTCRFSLFKVMRELLKGMILAVLFYFPSLQTFRKD